MITIRIGIGYDVHKLKENYKLILGGILIPHEKGLVAHSDGDCLIHAIIDSLLGAAGLYDIGSYFPDNDQKYKNINSLILLDKAYALLNKEGYIVSNIDSVIICERPKIKPYIDLMKKNISKVLHIPTTSIGIKATTEEKLGFTGREEGVACEAVCIIKKIGSY